jgi:hypothetical protein
LSFRPNKVSETPRLAAMASAVRWRYPLNAYNS